VQPRRIRKYESLRWVRATSPEEVLKYLQAAGLQEQVKTRLKAMFQVSFRTAERLLAAARRRLLARSGKTKQEHLQEALDFWESVVTGPDAALGQRMDAQRELIKLLGLNAPLRHALGGDPEAPPIPVEGPVEVRRASPPRRQQPRRNPSQRSRPAPRT
jgi:hypothetical protein